MRNRNHFRGMVRLLIRLPPDVPTLGPGRMRGKGAQVFRKRASARCLSAAADWGINPLVRVRRTIMTTNLLAQWSVLHRKQCGLSGAMLAAHEPGGWTPPTDVVESAKDLLVRMEVAGVARADLCIRLEGRALIVEGTRPSPCHAGLRFRQMEMEYGPFRRVVPLPFAVAGRRAVAELVDGVLEVFLPRTARRGESVTLMLVIRR